MERDPQKIITAEIVDGNEAGLTKLGAVAIRSMSLQQRDDFMNEAQFYAEQHFGGRSSIEVSETSVQQPKIRS